MTLWERNSMVGGSKSPQCGWQRGPIGVARDDVRTKLLLVHAVVSTELTPWGIDASVATCRPMIRIGISDASENTSLP